MKRYHNEDADVEENPCKRGENTGSSAEKTEEPPPDLSCRQLKKQINRDKKFFSRSARLSVNSN